jgi:hypothetical protein
VRPSYLTLAALFGDLTDRPTGAADIAGAIGALLNPVRDDPSDYNVVSSTRPGGLDPACPADMTTIIAFFAPSGEYLYVVFVDSVAAFADEVLLAISAAAGSVTIQTTSWIPHDDSDGTTSEGVPTDAWTAQTRSSVSLTGNFPERLATWTTTSTDITPTGIAVSLDGDPVIISSPVALTFQFFGGLEECSANSLAALSARVATPVGIAWRDWAARFSRSDGALLNTRGVSA